MKKLLVFDSHPVQYRVPIWQAMNRIAPGCVHVVYATDSSVKGHADKDFGKVIAWDEPLLEGYSYSVLHSVKGIPLSGWSSLSGEGVSKVLEDIRPDAILLTGFNYKYDWAAYHAAKKKRIPIWLRCETQDYAFARPFYKSFVRNNLYRYFYSSISRFFYIGNLNKLHYQKLGVPDSKLTPALYGTVDRYVGMDTETKKILREKVRTEEGILPNNLVIGFSGKLIYKKNPDILYKMLSYLPPQLRSKLIIYFIGSGELEGTLKEMSVLALEKYGVRSVFKGFINQSKIGEQYLALDILVLPSRRMGETWGLVVNEALQAGCGVIVSDAVGSSKNFAGAKRFRVFGIENEEELSKKVAELSEYVRDFNWAADILNPYSIQANAEAFLKYL